MQIILASAKIMNDKLKSVPDISLSTPRFQSEAESFARDMAQYSAETIAEMLGCSQQIAAQNRFRFMQFFDENPKLPAILAYHGMGGRSIQPVRAIKRVSTIPDRQKHSNNRQSTMPSHLWCQHSVRRFQRIRSHILFNIVMPLFLIPLLG